MNSRRTQSTELEGYLACVPVKMDLLNFRTSKYHILPYMDNISPAAAQGSVGHPLVNEWSLDAVHKTLHTGHCPQETVG